VQKSSSPAAAATMVPYVASSSTKASVLDGFNIRGKWCLILWGRD
jgi:hypothetical protein